MIRAAAPLRQNRRASGMCDELIGELTDVLESFAGEESFKEIFWSILSYDRQRLPLSRAGLRSDVAHILESLELFAKHDDIGIVLAEVSTEMSHDKLDVICRNLESRFASVIILLHDVHAGAWSIVYPDRSRKHHLRMLAIPGRSPDLRKTAKALAALTTVDWANEENYARLDVAKRLDVFFPGGMPKQRWEFDPASESAALDDSYLRQKAAPVEGLYKDISRYPLLTAYQERGEDLDELDFGNGEMTDYHWRLVLHNMRLVIHIALSFPTSVLDLEDLVQEGILGLIMAARKFDPSQGTRFSTYAWYWIRQCMFRAISVNRNLIRWPCYRAQDLVPANRDGQGDELLPGERYVKSFDGSELEIEDSVDCSDDDRLGQIEVAEALRATMESALYPRQRRILQQRFGFDGSEEKTLEEVGQAEGVTRERIRQIQKVATARLKNSLPAWMHHEFEEANGEAVTGESEDECTDE